MIWHWPETKHVLLGFTRIVITPCLGQCRLPWQITVDQGLKQQRFTSHSSGVWAEQISVWWGPTSWSVGGCLLIASSRGGEQRSRLSWHSYKGTNPSHGLPWWFSGKESACQCRDSGSGRPPREGNGNPLQYTCLENAIDRGAWWATVHGVTKESDMMTDQARACTHMSYIE